MSPRGPRAARPGPLLAATLLVAAAAGPAGARDVNPVGVPVGHRALGLAGAYTANAGDGVALWYNPAGLGALRTKAISANVTLYQWTRQTSEAFADFGPGEARGDLESSDFGTLPSSLVFSVPLGEPEAPRGGLAAGLFVPDDDSYDARVSAGLVVPAGAVQFKASDARAERSYWAGAGYGLDVGALSLGASAFAVLHTLRRQTLLTLFVDGVPDVTGASSAQHLTATDATAVVQAGVQYRVTPTFRLGLTLRSPSLGALFQSGELLVLNAADTADGFLDRHETDEVKAEHRLPLRLALGTAWRPSPPWLVALDLVYIGKVERYRVVRGPILAPRNARGEPLRGTTPEEEQAIADRSWDPTVFRQRDGVLNAALGVERQLSAKFVLRGGAYTDFSAAPSPGKEDLMDYQADLYGATIGMGYTGERGSTDIGLLFRRGTGDTLSDANVDFAPKQVGMEVLQIALYVAGSADL